MPALSVGVGGGGDEMNENGSTHRERLVILSRDRRCTECETGHRSVSVIEDDRGKRGVCGRCHIALTRPEIVKGRWGMPATWILPD